MLARIDLRRRRHRRADRGAGARATSGTADGLDGAGDGVRRGVPRGRHDDRGGPGPGRDHRPAHHPAPAGPRLRQRRRRPRCRCWSAPSRSSAPSSCCAILASLTEVSIFALNLTTAMGLGPGHRLQPLRRLPIPGGAGRRRSRRRGRDPHRSHGGAHRRVRQRCTVAASLCALLVFPLAFLRSFAYAGVAVAFLAGLSRRSCLPALLAALGHRVDKLTVVPPLEPEPVERRASGTAWPRPSCGGPCRSPTAVTAGAAAARQPVPRHRARPARRPGPARGAREPAGGRRHARRSSPRRRRAPCRSSPSGSGAPTAATAEIDAYAAELAGLDGVARVDAVTGSTSATGWPVGRLQPGTCSPELAVPGFAPLTTAVRPTCRWCPSVEPISTAGEDLVDDIRAAPRRSTCQVTGQSAELRRHQGDAARPAAAGRRHHRRRHLRAAVHDVRQRASSRSRRWCSTC